MHRPYDDWIVTPLRRLFSFRPAVRVSPPVMVAGLALVVIAAIYARSLDNYFQSDDFDWLYAYGMDAAETGTLQAVFAPPDPAAVDPADPFTWNYRPTTALLVNVLFRLFGVGAPAGYHAILIAGHLAASALAGALAGRLTRRAWAGTAVVAVFGLHFANVETVAWFGSIAEVVAGVLGLAAVLAFLQFRETGRARWAWTAIVVVRPGARRQPHRSADHRGVRAAGRLALRSRRRPQLVCALDLRAAAGAGGRIPRH